MAFKIVVSEKELSYQFEVDNTKQLNGLKIGEEFDGQIVGLDGYTLKITGGSDKKILFKSTLLLPKQVANPYLIS